MKEELRISEEQQKNLEANGMAAFSDASVTDAGVTVTAQQSITDNYYTYLSFKVEGYSVENLNYYLYSGSVNQLFGLSWTDRESIDYTTNNKLIEIDYFDILIHYGIIGFIIYFLPLVVFLFYTIINIKYIKVETYIYLFTIITILGAALLAGHIFSAPAVSIYLILLMIISLFEIDKNKEEKSGGSK